MIPESVVRSKDLMQADRMEESKEEEDPEADKPAWLRGFNSVEWKSKSYLRLKTDPPREVPA